MSQRHRSIHLNRRRGNRDPRPDQINLTAHQAHSFAPPQTRVRAHQDECSVAIRQGRWTITARDTQERFVSGIDAEPGTPSDLAYVSARTVGDTRLLLIAGVHAIGSLGAVTYLSEHADTLYEQAGLQEFTAVIRCAFDGSTITRTDLATNIRTW